MLKVAKFALWQKDRLTLADGDFGRCDIGMEIAFIKKHLRFCMKNHNEKRELNCLFLEC